MCPDVVCPDKVSGPDAIAFLWPHPTKVTAARVSSRNANDFAALLAPVKLAMKSVESNVLGTVVTCAVSNFHVWMLFGFFIHCISNTLKQFKRKFFHYVLIMNINALFTGRVSPAFVSIVLVKNPLLSVATVISVEFIVTELTSPRGPVCPSPSSFPKV
ncbi:hypothetical protein UFOVP1450_9 [uncultured Caudovirales phage]|uniref:Uncharacterized protein n=1 Tax=uncultured Caudovirales phage TaxID=2100421 RepID=A0A6J5SHM6_9CAUD|nr:hypothetical protein UFOVP1450_9 [uncultured Caudovirales phage]